jgi:serine/threonine-protein kinase
MLPRTFGRYEIESLLGEGGMGRVYKARDPLIERTVAIKTLGVELEGGELAEFRERFLREARSAGRVNHPNVVTIFDVGELADGTAFITMEYVEGRTLRALLDAGPPLPVAESCRIGARVGEALAAAHRHGIVHRDVKPPNIMLGADGAVKLMDFGIARLPDGMRTRTGLIVGTPTYLAPEQIVGRGADKRSDIYALGVVLYEMLTGVPPFRKGSVTDLLNAIVGERHAPPSAHNHRVPAVFERILARALAKHPDDRYQDATELARDLERWRSLPRPTPEELAAIRSAPLRRLERPTPPATGA